MEKLEINKGDMCELPPGFFKKELSMSHFSILSVLVALVVTFLVGCKLFNKAKAAKKTKKVTKKRKATKTAKKKKTTRKK